jgi:hypothetical protein
MSRQTWRRQGPYAELSWDGIPSKECDPQVQVSMPALFLTCLKNSLPS